MPELPEVETICRGLDRTMTGRTISGVEVRRPDLRFPLPVDFAARLEGRRVIRIDRRAKYVLARTDDAQVLIMHMGMSGRLSFWQPEDDDGRAPDPGAHDHIRFQIGNGTLVTFHDPRRFGYMSVCDEAELEDHPYFCNLGPEPLSDAFDARYLDQALAGKKTAIKTALLDQKIVAGLGNIYVCEALFEAGISPRRQAHTISGRRAARLVPAIKDVLERAIEAGGSTLRDYARVDGELGYFQFSFAVYGRDGEPCGRDGCESIIQRIVQGGRSTFFCGRTQR